MACQQLAATYASSTAHPIPATDADIETVRGPWLITRQFGCQPSPDFVINMNTDECAAVMQPAAAGPGQTTAFVSAGAPLVIIQETGFLAWVNERGLQCINKVTGLVNRAPVVNGTPYKDPGIDKAFLPTFCNKECYNVLPDQIGCFECVKAALENPANDLTETCPALWNGSTPVDTGLMQQSLQCHACIANKSASLVTTTSTQDSKGNTVYSQTYNEGSFNNIWTCVTGDNGLSAGAIAGITLGIAAFLALVIGLSVYFAKKRKKQSQSVANHDG